MNKGLSHLAIPDGFSWGGKVSKHEPLWCTMYGTSESKNSSQHEEASEEGDEDVPAR